MIRERVEIAPRAAPPVEAPDPRTAAPAPRRFPGAGRDAADLPVDPLQFGPIRGYTLYVADYGPFALEPRLTAAQPGQPTDATLEILRGTESLGVFPLAPAYAQTDTYSIGVFNGSTCGDGDWFYTDFERVPGIAVARVPAGQGLSPRVDPGGADCLRPNSITDWCSCHLNTLEPTKYVEGFGAAGLSKPIVASELLVTAVPDTLEAGGASELALRLIDAHGYEVNLREVSGFDGATAATLTAPADSAGRGLTLGGALPTARVETTYDAARGGAVGYVAGDTLWYDTPVTVAASAGSFSGSGRLVVRGTRGTGPDSLVAASVVPSVPCGDSTAVLLDGFLDGERRPLPDSARVTLAVSDSVRTAVAYGGVRARELTVPAVALRDSTFQFVTRNCGDLDGEVSVEVTITVEAPWAAGGALTTTLTVSLVPPRLALVVTPSAVRAGERAGLSIETVLPSETPVSLSVSDGSVGGFERVGSAARTGEAVGAARGGVAGSASLGSFSSTVGELAAWRFVGAAVAEPATATLTALVGGREATAAVVVEPATVSLAVLRQDGTPISPVGGYLMVSKVRPDWLLPIDAQAFGAFGGASAFTNETAGRPSLSQAHDPDTYRFEASGLPASLSGDVVFRLDLGGDPIWTDGQEGGAAQQTAEYAAVCESGTSTTVCRSDRFVRLVSNARPAVGAITADGAYDDERAGTQTIRAELGDQVRVSAFLIESSGTERDLLPGGITLPVGAPPGSGADDAVRQALLMWHVYLPQTEAAVAPDVVTDRMSEDWAQAGIQFRQAAPARAVTPNGLLNTIVLRVPNRLGAGDTGTVDGVVSRRGTPYPFSVTFGSQTPTALSVAREIVTQVEAAGGPNATVFFLKGRGGAATEIAAVFDDARVSVSTSNRNLVRAGRRSPFFDLTTFGPRSLQSDAALVFARALHDPANRAVVSGTALDVVNVFVAPRHAVRAVSQRGEALAVASGDVNNKNPNTVLLPEDAASARDNLALVAGHEVGHVLLVRDFAGSDGAHHPRGYNLMSPAVSLNPSAISLRNEGRESLGAPKRLTPGQQASARCESGTGTSPLCLPNEPRGPSRLLSAPGAPSFTPTPSLRGSSEETDLASTSSQ